MYNIYHLRTDTKEQFYDKCKDAGLIDDDDDIKTSSHSYCLDVIGTIYAPTGEALTGDDGIEYPELKPLEGYHANLKAKTVTGLESLAIEVDNPQRKFSGD